MSNLFGMMQTGVSGIFAAQVGIDVIGHNIANMKNENYSRQSVSMVTNKPQYTTIGTMGKGVKVEGIVRSYDDLLAKSMRNENSSYSFYSSMQTSLKEAMLYFNELEAGSGLGDALQDYFDAWQDISNSAPDKTDEASVKRLTLVQAASTLSKKMREGYTSLEELQAKTNVNIKNDIDTVNQTSRSIAELNKQISLTEFAGDSANDLRDQREALLNRLSSITSISTYERDNGQIAVMIAGQAIVDGGSSHMLEAKANPKNDNRLEIFWKTNNSNSTPVNITSNLAGGSLTASVKTRDDVLQGYMDNLDEMAKSMISETNKIHVSGQGLERYTSITGTNGPANPKYNFSSEPGKLPYEIKNGTFRIVAYKMEEVKGTDSDGKPTTTKNEVAQYIDIDVDVDNDNMYSIVEKINAASGGSITATISKDNNSLSLSAATGKTISFGEDTSGFLVATGLNCFFTGTSAKDMDMNEILVSNPKFIATGQSSKEGDNENAKMIAALSNTRLNNDNGSTLSEFYGYFTGKMSSDKNQVDVFTATKKSSHGQLETRLESIKGVSENEELTNLSMFQRVFESNSRFVNVVDEMLNTVINGLGAGGR